jgi:hypothetical protein
MGEPAIQISREGCPTLIQALGNRYRFRRRRDGQFEDTPEKLHPWSDVADALQYISYYHPPDYIRSLGDEIAEDGCFLCKYWSNPSDDAKNHVVWRCDSTFAVMNPGPRIDRKARIRYLSTDRLAVRRTSGRGMGCSPRKKNQSSH